MKQSELIQVRRRRAVRSRAKLHGTAERPRLSVFRSNNFIYAQLIDDEAQKTLLSVSSRGIKDKANKTALAEKVGESLAKKASDMGVKKAIFDRGSYLYHGRVKALAESARKAGLEF